MYNIPVGSFEWDEEKNRINSEKHGVTFEDAQHAFLDPNRLIVVDEGHSTESEQRLHCIGMVSKRILTVRFVYRNDKIRVLGAGFWRKGKRTYEKED